MARTMGEMLGLDEYEGMDENEERFEFGAGDPAELGDRLGDGWQDTANGYYADDDEDDDDEDDDDEDDDEDEDDEESYEGFR